MENINPIEIYNKDFEELNAKEKFFLRNELRKLYQYPSEKKIDNLLLNFFLMQKVKFVEDGSETKYFVPIVRNSQCNVNTFNGIEGKCTGNFTINRSGIFLPVIMMSTTEKYIQCYCIAPDNNFCLLTSQFFKFEI